MPNRYGCEILPIDIKGNQITTLSRNILRENFTQSDVGGLNVRPWATWIRDAGDLNISTELEILSNKFRATTFHISSPTWNSTISSNCFSYEKSMDPRTSFRGTLYSVKCSCDRMAPDPNCLCRIAHLGLEIGAGHTWENGSTSRIAVGTFSRGFCAKGYKFKIEHIQPGPYGFVILGAEKISLPGAESKWNLSIKSWLGSFVRG
jgi:hypothetical protein